MKMLTHSAVASRKVVVRVDWNVTLGKALQIVDDTRIVRTLPTIRWLLDNGVQRVVIIAHLGKAEEKRSLEPVVRYAERLLGQPIAFYRTIEECASDNESPIVMLDNIRLWEGEDANDPTFAGQLASLGDVYVNEAFGESHRTSASIVGVARLLPSYAGMWLVDEVETILKVRDHAERPFTVIMGGAKVDDKIKLLDVLSYRADTILLGGKLANEFAIRGMKLSGSARVILPSEGVDLYDIGEETQKRFAQEISKAKTIVWNGPMGKVEDPQYQAGTQAIYTALLVNEAAYTVVGGGDTLAAIGQEEHISRIDHVSTGGGAMLKLLEAGTLPGIDALG